MEAKVKPRRTRKIIRLLHKLDAECKRAINESLPGSSEAGKREPIVTQELARIYRARAYALGTLENLGERRAS